MSASPPTAETWLLASQNAPWPPPCSKHNVILFLFSALLLSPICMPIPQLPGSPAANPSSTKPLLAVLEISVPPLEISAPPLEINPGQPHSSPLPAPQRLAQMDRLHIPVCDVTHNQGAEEEAQVHTGLEKVDLPGVSTHQVKLQPAVETEQKQDSWESQGPIPILCQTKQTAPTEVHPSPTPPQLPTGWIRHKFPRRRKHQHRSGSAMPSFFLTPWCL